MPSERDGNGTAMADGRADGAGPGSGVSVRRVLKAYEQIAEQLHALIVAGELAPGERLPTETVLARDFGVSRATVREALRVLAAQGLIMTAKGSGGGSYVTLPTPDDISAYVSASVALLTVAEDVSLDELLDAREVVELPTTRLAAARRSDEDIDRLRSTIPGDPRALATGERFRRNFEFHVVLLQAARNTLLRIAAQPVLRVLERNLDRSSFGPDFYETVHGEHAAIADAVEAGDAERAASLMREHLHDLRAPYERGWRHGRVTTAEG